MKSFSKNPLRLDIAIKHKVLSIYQLAYAVAVLCLAWQAVPVWAFGVLVAIAIFVIVLLVYRPKAVMLSCTHLDEMWDIGVLAGSKRQLWQGYLTDAKAMNALDKAVLLRFYVIEPKRRTLDVVIHRRDVSDDDFRKLLGLCAIEPLFLKG